MQETEKEILQVKPDPSIPFLIIDYSLVSERWLAFLWKKGSTLLENLGILEWKAVSA